MTGGATAGARTAIRLLGGAALISLATTIVLGLGLPPTEEQGEYVRMIAIHPPLAWASYLCFGACALASIAYLVPRTRGIGWDHLAGAAAEAGVVFTALTLVTGSIWGRPTWGVWWVWDARLTLTALLLFLFLGYLALRRVAAEPHTRARRSAVAALLAVLVVPIDHFAVEWWRTLHQKSSLTITPKENLDGNYIAVMLLGLAAMTLVAVWLVAQRYLLEAREDEAGEADLEAAIAERRAEGVPA
jgi:heme exporter protein C